MLGIILIYFIGKQFYKLADEFDRNRWVFAILGVIVFYAGQFIFGILIAFSDELLDTSFVDSMSEIALNLIGIPVGVLSCVGLYFFLNRSWKKNVKPEENLIDEIGKF